MFSGLHLENFGLKDNILLYSVCHYTYIPMQEQKKKKKTTTTVFAKLHIKQPFYQDSHHDNCLGKDRTKNPDRSLESQDNLLGEPKWIVEVICQVELQGK